VQLYLVTLVDASTSTKKASGVKPANEIHRLHAESQKIKLTALNRT
jgi:hypothetical protein